MLEGLLAPHQRRVRSIRHRQDRGEGQRGPVYDRGTAGHGSCEQPLAAVELELDARVERHQRRFHPAGERARAARKRQLRQDRDQHQVLGRRAAAEPARELVIVRLVPARAAAGDGGRHRVLPHRVAEIHGDRQLVGDPRRLHAVLRHLAGGPAVAGRRRLYGNGVRC